MNGKRTLRSEGKALSFDYVAAQWPELPPHVREAIVTLVDAAKTVDEQQNTAPSNDRVKE